MYPVDPCSGDFILGRPFVSHASLKVPGGELQIRVHNQGMRLSSGCAGFGLRGLGGRVWSLGFGVWVAGFGVWEVGLGALSGWP